MGLLDSLFSGLQPVAPGGAPAASIFANPNFQSLAALASAFGQGAMPQPYKVPFGAILGQAAGAMAGGANNANTFAQNQANAQQTQLNNTLFAASMPTRLALVSSSIGGVQPGAPGGQPAGASSTPGGPPQAPGPAGAPSGPGPTYLQSPQQTEAMIRFLVATGQDRAAAAMISGLQNQAGGPGFALAPDGTAFAVPGGGKDPNVVAGLSAANESGTLAADNANKPINIGTPTHPIFTTANQAGVVGGSTQPNAAVMSPFDYAARVSANENPGGNPDAQNPNSTATGNGQFTDATWLSTMRQAVPSLAQVPDAQLLAMRSDPGLSQLGTIVLGQQNAGALTSAGLPPTAANLGLSHFLGVGSSSSPGAIQVLKAPPSTPLSQILSPAALRANPQLSGMTAGALTFQYGLKYGNVLVNFGQSPQQPGASKTEVAPGVTVAQLPGGGVAVNDTGGVQNNEIDGDQESISTLQDSIGARANAAATFNEAAATASQYPTGAFAKVKLDLSNAVTSAFGPEAAKYLDLPDAAKGQEIVKAFTLAAGQTEREQQGARPSLGALNIYMKNLPNPATQDEAIQDLNNIFQLQQAYEIQYAAGAQDFYNSARTTYVKGQGDYTPVSQYDQQFNEKMANGRVLAGAFMASTGLPYSKWSAGLTPQQQSQVLQFTWQTLPDVTVLDQNGQPRRFQQQ